MNELLQTRSIYSYSVKEVSQAETFQITGSVPTLSESWTESWTESPTESWTKLYH